MVARPKARDVSVGISADIVAQIDAEARMHFRSRSAQVEYILVQWLREHSREETKEEITV